MPVKQVYTFFHRKMLGKQENGGQCEVGVPKLQHGRGWGGKETTTEEQK